MPRHKLTDAFVKSAAPPAFGQVDIFDIAMPGLSLRLAAGGTKTWTLFYRSAGEQRRQGLGRYPAVTLREARRKAGAVQDLLDAGKDPRLEAERERRAATDARGNTIDAVARRFFGEIGATDEPAGQPTRKGRVRKGSVLRSAGEVKRILEKYILPKIGNRPISDVSRRELIALFDGIADYHGGIMANRSLSWTRRLFSFAIEKAIIDASPCAGIKPPASETERQRTLSDDEIREVWAAADALAYPFGSAFKLILLTATRISEAAQAPWSEFDKDKALWMIPAARYKSQIDHAIPLASAVMHLIFGDSDGNGGLPVLGDRLFSTRGGKALNSFSYMKVELDRVILENRRKTSAKAKPLPHWTAHDLRRTVATGMGNLGISGEVIDRCLGHKRSKLARTYNTSEGVPEKRAAFERWARHLAGIVEGRPAKVVEIGGRR